MWLVDHITLITISNSGIVVAELKPRPITPLMPRNRAGWSSGIRYLAGNDCALSPDANRRRMPPKAICVSRSHDTTGRPLRWIFEQVVLNFQNILICKPLKRFASKWPIRQACFGRNSDETGIVLTTLFEKLYSCGSFIRFAFAPLNDGRIVCSAPFSRPQLKCSRSSYESDRGFDPTRSPSN